MTQQSNPALQTAALRMCSQHRASDHDVHFGSNTWGVEQRIQQGLCRAAQGAHGAQRRATVERTVDTVGSMSLPTEWRAIFPFFSTVFSTLNRETCTATWSLSVASWSG